MIGTRTEERSYLENLKLQSKAILERVNRKRNLVKRNLELFDAVIMAIKDTNDTFTVIWRHNGKNRRVTRAKLNGDNFIFAVEGEKIRFSHTFSATIRAEFSFMENVEVKPHEVIEYLT